MRPYIAGRVVQWTRSREHGDRPFAGKRNLRRMYKKSERQHGRQVIKTELVALEAQRQQESDDLAREQAELEAYEADQRAFTESKFQTLNPDDIWDASWYDDAWYDDDYRCASASDWWDDSYRYDDQFYYTTDLAYEQHAEDERADRREYDRRWDYDWDEDPDFKPAKEEQAAMAGARDGFDIFAWRSRKS